MEQLEQKLKADRRDTSAKLKVALVAIHDTKEDSEGSINCGYNVFSEWLLRLRADNSSNLE